MACKKFCPHRILHINQPSWTNFSQSPNKSCSSAILNASCHDLTNWISNQYQRQILTLVSTSDTDFDYKLKKTNCVECWIQVGFANMVHVVQRHQLKLNLASTSRSVYTCACWDHVGQSYSIFHVLFWCHIVRVWSVLRQFAL